MSADPPGSYPQRTPSGFLSSPRLRFLAGRVVQAVLTLWALSLVTFVLGALAKSSPVEQKLGQHADPALIAETRHLYGLDRPIPERYARWLWAFLHGDLGLSYRYEGQPVGPMLAKRYPLTLRLGSMAAGFAVLAGIPLGLIAALRHGTWIDRLATTVALGGVSVPSFVLLPLLVLLLAVRWRVFPVTYEREWWHLILPALALGTRPAALVARMTRASFLEALGQDYVRSARAKGLGWAGTVVRHAGKNALVPILTVFGTSVGYLLGGSFVVETIFAVPGIGGFTISSISDRDYPLIQAVTLLAAAVFIGVNLLVDLLYGLLDPRLRSAAS